LDIGDPHRELRRSPAHPAGMDITRTGITTLAAVGFMAKSVKRFPLGGDPEPALSRLPESGAVRPRCAE
jgi:hypothetical protein